MSDDGDLSSFEVSLAEVFRKMGLPDPIVMSQLMDEWDTLAGEPWKGRSRPIVLKGKTLIVETSAPSMVALLRYGKASLLEALIERFGPGVIDQIEVRPPARN